jgi:D-lactate dehydrogenase
MKVLVFEADTAVREIFGKALAGHEVAYIGAHVSLEELAKHADAKVVSLFVASAFAKEHIDALPNLKCIAARSTGVDHIDVAYAKEKGIIISNVPRYGAHTVAEFTFALLLSLSRRIPEALEQVREKGSFKTGALEGFDLFGKTIGVVGTGAIGRHVVGIAKGFGMKVLMNDRHPDVALQSDGARFVEMDELLASSDVITLHVPALAENKHMLGKVEFAKMKQGAYIINTARGELIDTEALLEALKSGRIAGAGTDVLEEERVLKDEIELVKGIESMKSIIRDHILVDTPRVVVTPHIAFFSREAYHEILTTSAENVAAFIAGSPKNVVWA